MKVVRFLERENVIKFFGWALIFAPFVNVALHIMVLKSQTTYTWAQLSLLDYFKSGNPLSYLLAAVSVFIGTRMLSGSTSAWKYVLGLLGAHLIIQIANINNKAWSGPLAWPTFLLNAGLFIFIMDQLVWKIKVENSVQKPENLVIPIQKNKQVVNLKSYRKILFNFGSTYPWGELKTLSSEEISVKSIAEVPESIEHKTVQINFAKDVIIEIKFDRKEGDIYFFKPLNMQKENVTRLNKWLKKIAV